MCGRVTGRAGRPTVLGDGSAQEAGGEQAQGADARECLARTHWHHARWMRRPPIRTGFTRTKCSHSASGHGSAPALMIEARSASVST
jgi:hypothetical protein